MGALQAPLGPVATAAAGHAHRPAWGTASSPANSLGCVTAHAGAHTGRVPGGLAVGGRRLQGWGLMLSVISGERPRAEQGSLRGVLVPPRGAVHAARTDVGPHMHGTIASPVPHPPSCLHRLCGTHSRFLPWSARTLWGYLRHRPAREAVQYPYGTALALGAERPRLEVATTSALMDTTDSPLHDLRVTVMPAFTHRCLTPIP